MFEWDAGKAATNQAKHGVRFATGVRVFDDPDRLVFDVTRARDQEQRQKAIGMIDGRLFTVVFTIRGDAHRIISARRANSKEDRSYGQIVRMTAEEAREKGQLTPAEKARLDAMTDEEITAAALSDPDNPPWTDEEFARARRVGRPPMAEEDRKVSLSLRLDPDVVEQFRATGPGWQTRMGEVLSNHLKRSRKRA